MNEAIEMLSLNEAADRLGLHYMTVYKYVRSGKLPARKSGGSWEVSVTIWPPCRLSSGPRRVEATVARKQNWTVSPGLACGRYELVLG